MNIVITVSGATGTGTIGLAALIHDFLKKEGIEAAIDGLDLKAFVHDSDPDRLERVKAVFRDRNITVRTQAFNRVP